MNERKRSSGLFADPGVIAPSVDKRWRDVFIVELRLQSVAGDRIGDALMTVETHVSESGESALEAFGDPKTYAREIAESTGAAGSGSVIGVWSGIGIVLGLLGMLVAVEAFTGWLEGTSVTVTLGELVGLAVLLALAGLLLTGRLLRAMVERRWLAFVGPVVLVASLAGIFLLLPEPLFEVPALAVGTFSLLLLLTHVLISVFDQAEDQEEITVPGQVPTSSRARMLSFTVMPLMTVFLLGFVWTLHLITG